MLGAGKLNGVDCPGEQIHIDKLLIYCRIDDQGYDGSE